MTLHLPDRTQPAEGERGFGLIEIVVCIFLLGVIAVAFIPLFIQGLKIAAKNATVATATQIVNEQLEMARATAPYCPNFWDSASSGYATVSPVTVGPDPRGITYTATRTVDPCAAGDSYPKIIQVTVSVKVAGSTAPALANATTYVRLLAGTP